MSLSIRIRLSVMMFLQYMMFAVWWQPMAAYLTKLGIEGDAKAWILSVMPLGCLIAPVFCMVADRHFASQKVLTALNLGCAVLFFLGARVTGSGALFVILLLSTFCYMPTWSLTNAIAMTHATTEEFPRIRVFGSIGWAASALPSLVALMLFGGMKIDATAIPLYCGAGAALVATVLNLTLPNTPPPAKGKKASVVDALGLRALTLMKDRNFTLFILVSMLVMTPFTLYFSFCSQFLESQGYKMITAMMSLGQFAEIFLMLLVPIALARYGIRWTMILGLVALTARYVAFLAGVTLDQQWLYYIAIALHGIIFGFFFVGGQVYVDKKAPPEIRAQAQGLIVLICFGVGMLVGTFFSERLINIYTNEEMVGGVLQKIYNWRMIFSITMVITAVLLGLFALLFRDDVSKAEEPKKASQNPDQKQLKEA
jgi:nucleoside transporter